MGEPKTQCATCGAPILQRTANENNGLCVPCRRAAAAIPPAHFQLPSELVYRIESLEFDPLDFRKMAWRNGVQFVSGYLDKIDEKNARYDEWLPRLRQFAQKCRDNLPPPSHDELEGRDLAKLKIYEAKIASAEQLPQRSHTALICSLPRIAMPLAQRLWPGRQEAVLLTREELSQWNEVYQHPETSFWWFVHYWCSIDETPERIESFGGRTKSQWEEADVPSGSEAWLVESGLQWGPMAGGCNTDLWLWNGRECRFAKEVSRMDY